MPSVSPPSADPEVVATLLALVRDLERSQRSEDVEGFLDLFDTDAVWVTAGGRRLIGLPTISEFTHQVLPGAFADGGTVTYEVEHVLFIDDRTALTGVRQQYFDAAGSATAAGLPSYVWRRTDKVWRIIIGQNTTIPDQ